jgi:5'(3')-deoxyribonucleotidase
MQNKKKPTLYLDMDGVLADFNSRAKEILGATDSEEQRAAQTGRWPDHKWQELVNYPNFYLDLPKMPMADQLVELALRFRDNLGYDVKILTAIPSGNDMPDAFHDKIDWVNRYYGAHGFRVHFGPYSHDKAHHCQGADDILVDDRTSNCEEWRRAGGAAIQVLDGEYLRAILDLEAIFHDLMMYSMV